MKKVAKLDSLGFAHWILPAIIVVVIAFVGFSVYKTSQMSKSNAIRQGSVGTTLPSVAGSLLKLPINYVKTIKNAPAPNPNHSLTQESIPDEGWTGYSLIGPVNSYTMVEATITVPRVTCPSTTRPSELSLWVGLDGFNVGSTTVEQDEIRANCVPELSGCNAQGQDCTNSYQPYYYAWTETYPDPLFATAIPLQPGNIVRMEVWYDNSKNKFALYLHNESLGNASDASSLQYSSCPAENVCDRNSAEWISENHVTQDQLLISNFGQVSFDDAEASTSPFLISYPFTDWRNYPIYAVAHNDTLETVNGPLNETASSFNITQLRND